MRKVDDVRTFMQYKNANKKDKSLLDFFGIFLQSLIKWLVSQKNQQASPC